MFISQRNRSYDRSGSQSARGRFLCVFSHNSYMWEEQHNTPHTGLHGQSIEVLAGEGFTVLKTCRCDTEYYTLKHCPVHSAEYARMPSDLSRVLYAHVSNHVVLKQVGHFMMGIARDLPVSHSSYDSENGRNWKHLILSGTYGSDGLPCDYEKLAPSARAKLVRVPDYLTAAFWSGGGHNSAGSEALAMRDWALATFTSTARRRR